MKISALAWLCSGHVWVHSWHKSNCLRHHTQLTQIAPGDFPCPLRWRHSAPHCSGLARMLLTQMGRPIADKATIAGSKGDDLRPQVLWVDANCRPDPVWPSSNLHKPGSAHAPGVPLAAPLLQDDILSLPAQPFMAHVKFTPWLRKRCTQARNKGAAFISTGNTRPELPTKQAIPSASHHWRIA